MKLRFKEQVTERLFEEKQIDVLGFVVPIKPKLAIKERLDTNDFLALRE